MSSRCILMFSRAAKWPSGSVSRPDDVPVVEFGKLNADAVRIADRAGWK